VQVANNIQSEPVISEQLTLLSRGGSSVSFGNIQLIPVGESIVYIQPIFVQRSGAQGFPQFTFVAVFTEGKDAVIASTVQKGLNQLFDLEPTTPETPETPETPDQTDQTPSDLLAQAAEKFAEADAALKAGNLGEYQELVGDAQDLVDQALELLNAAGSGDSTTDSSTTTSTTGPPAEAPFTSSEAQAALGP
jgi:hypothetical protein